MGKNHTPDPFVVLHASNDEMVLEIILSVLALSTFGTLQARSKIAKKTTHPIWNQVGF